MEPRKHRHTFPFDSSDQVIHHLIYVGAVFLDEPDIGPVVDVSPEHLFQTFSVKGQTPRQIPVWLREGVKPRLTEGLPKSPLQLTVPVVGAELTVPFRRLLWRFNEPGHRRNPGAYRDGR